MRENSIAVLGLVMWAVLCPLWGGTDVPDHLMKDSGLAQLLVGDWQGRYRGSDGQGICEIVSKLSFDSKGGVVMTDKFYPVKHRKPTWGSIAHPGKWRLDHGNLVVQWDGNGEHPSGLTTKWQILKTSQNQFQLEEGEHGVCSYDRVKSVLH